MSASRSWKRHELTGVKAAEYRLTSKGDGVHPVYTFCMCPGGNVVQASPYEKASIVNGMSRYRRNGRYANAACVAGVSPAQLIGAESTPLQALDWLAKQMHTTCGLTVDLDADSEANFQSEALRSFIYKATQEMLFNVIKHARVRRARVKLRRHNGFIQLTVADRGEGFDSDRLRRNEGFGLFSIQERASLLGGRMRVKSAPGRGCVFLLSIPADSDTK